MTKISFKKFFVVILVCLTCLLSIFSFSACSDENGKEITTEYAFAKLEEKDKKGISRREKLINSYEDYDYIELEVHFYNEETFKLERIVEIYLRNVYEEKDGVIKKIDMQVYTEEYEVETKTTRYTLLKRQLDHVELYTSISVDNDLVKEPAVIHDISEFNEFLDGFFAEFYKEEYLPRTEDVIEKAYKKTFSTDVNRMKSIEILFKNGEAYNEVSFNYDTDKIHFVREYNSERNLLREIEYTYSGNFVTGVKDIDYKKFDMHETCTPKDPVRENEVPSTCNVKGTYDEVIYCALCNEEISREQKEIEEFAPCVDEDEDGICDLCHKEAEALLNGVYYKSFIEAVNVAEAEQTVVLLKNLTGEGLVINKSITIDFGGFTYTVNKCVGSTGTETLGFQLLKDNTIVFKNGTIAAVSVAEIVEGKPVKMLVQNYSNLTLENMILDGTGSEEMKYVLSNNCGDSFIKGTSKIKAPEGAVAFDVYNYSSAGYSLPTLTVDSTVEVIGKIEALGGQEGVEGGMKYYPENYTKE